MNVSIIGSRGIPAKYGGYEVFAEQLSIGLAKKNYLTTVCCEHMGKNLKNYRGVYLEYFPLSPPNNYTLRKFYEIVNDIYFMIKTAKSSDYIYVCGTTAGGMLFLPKILNKKVKTLVNIGGLEWKRDKWNKFERSLLRLNTILAIRFADIVIVDSKSMEKYVGIDGGHKTIFIPYGAEIPNIVSWDNNMLARLSKSCRETINIEKNNYWLEIARLEPDNNIHIVLDGYLKSMSKKPLVVVGDYTSKDYKKTIEKILKNDMEKRVFMVGGIYNDNGLLNMLRQNCFGYIHAHSFGGTNPSLLEAMASKLIILANCNEFNKEVCADSALYFEDANDLKNKIEIIESNSEKYLNLKEKSYTRVTTIYSWENIINQYQKLFDKLWVGSI